MEQSEINELAVKGIRMEIERLNEALAALEGRSSKPGPKPKSKRKPMSAAAKKAVAARMKKYWAERRAAKPKKD